MNHAPAFGYRLHLRLKKKKEKHWHTNVTPYILPTPLLWWVLRVLKHEEVQEIKYLYGNTDFRHSSETKIVFLLHFNGEFRVCDVPQIRISNLHYITGINHCENAKKIYKYIHNNSYTLATHVRSEHKQNSAASRQTIKTHIIYHPVMHCVLGKYYTYKWETCASEVQPLGINPQ